MPKSELENAFLALWPRVCRANGIEPVMPQREFVFAAPRRWRFDFAWPEQRVAVEIEGGVWSRGRHVTPQGFLKDLEKYNAAAALGWSVLRFAGEAIERQPQDVCETIWQTMLARDN